MRTAERHLITVGPNTNSIYYKGPTFEEWWAEWKRKAVEEGHLLRGSLNTGFYHRKFTQEEVDALVIGRDTDARGPAIFEEV